MVRADRRSVVRSLGIAVATGLAGCSSGPDDGGSSGTPSSSEQGATTDGASGTPPGSETASPDRSSGTPRSTGAPSPDQAVRAVVGGVDAGAIDAIRRVSIGFENLGEEGASPNATLYLPDDGDPLATDMTQGDATARHAYGNFEPDGQHLEVESVDVGSSPDKQEWAEQFNEMDGPEVAAVRRPEPTIQYRINWEGTWYDGSAQPPVTTVEIDGRWYVGTAITPWHVVTTLIPEDAGLSPERIAQIRQSVTLPLGAEGTATEDGA